MSAVKQATELKELPLLALLALGARCARRVSHLVHLIDHHAEAAWCSRAVDAAVRFAEALAAGQNVDLDELDSAEDGAMRAVIVVSEIHPPCEQAAYAANAAYAAISAARAVLEVVGTGALIEEAERVVEAVKITWDSANSADERVGDAAQSDWQMLRRSIAGAFPDLGKPVDTSEHGVLGPLFPDEPSAPSAQTCGPAMTDCLEADRSQFEAERTMLYDEIARLRKSCIAIENLRQQDRDDLESTRAEIERLRCEQQQSLPLQRDDRERWHVKQPWEAALQHGTSPTEHKSILRIDNGGGASAVAARGCHDSLAVRACQTLRLVLDPGRADGQCISEILSEVIVLGRMSGIAFAKLQGREHALCGSSRSDTVSSNSALIETQVAFELLLTAGERNQPRSSDGRLWEQFEASLRTVMAVRHGLAGVRRPTDSRDGDRAFTTTGGIVALSSPTVTGQVGREAGNESSIATVESMQRQLQRIADLLLRAENDHGAKLELVGQYKGHRRCDTLHANESRSNAPRRICPAPYRKSRRAMDSTK